jgi:predicted metal-dependent peptidase
MSRESRIRPDYFPGKKLDRGLDCILAMDTSGSICGEDWNDYCNQVIRIAKDFNAQQLRVIQCHTRVSFDSMVNISKINKMNVKETGGTMMQVIFERLKKEKNRKPVILFTDGDIDHFSPKLYNFKILMFLSRGHSYNKPILEEIGHHVICQDEE